MVDRIDVGVDHRGSLGICACNEDQGRVQDIRLQTDGNQALNVLLSGDEDLAAHVAALLGARLLVLDVDPSSASLNEHLGQLHGGGKATVPRVCIRDDGVQVVHAGRLGTVRRAHAPALLVLLSVVEELGTEELVHLVGHGVVGVVRHVGARLVRGGGGGGALPAAHVDGGEVLGHLRDLHGVQRPEGVGAGALGLVLPQHFVQLVRDGRAGELEREGALQLHHVLNLVGPSGVLKALAAHPGLHLLHSALEVGILRRHTAHLHAATGRGIAGQDLALDRRKAVGHGSGPSVELEGA
mmetsp:Transcript_44348/g.105605  ORF Transcript_44348/g.105605 Transcript_44348/m.105605 type:complete len:297 (+) Transcript_44348:885-1775(+)